MASLFSDKLASPSGTPCPVSLTVPHFLLSSASFPLASADSASSRALAPTSEHLLLLRSDLALQQSRCALRGTFGHRSSKKSKQPKSSVAGPPASRKGLDSLIDNARRFILLTCWKRSEVSHHPQLRACVCPRRFLTPRGPLRASLWSFAIVRRRWTDDGSHPTALRWLYRDPL
jgi:hypothetical protein